MIPFKNRFHGHSSLNYVYKNGQAVRCHSMIIKTVANKHRQDSRIAVVIGKKTLKSAVGRNRIRRRIYEVIRIILPKLNGVYDIAFIITASDIINISQQEMIDQIEQLLGQSKILVKK